ncbi:MAG: hypothetical protein MJ222_01500 [Bacilli bacterium]|nr:hypothetical protein [Bacilli bacterium]
MKNKKKNYFFGKYYKFVNQLGYSFALIDADTSKGKVIQLINENESYVINDPKQICVGENNIEFNVNQEGLTIIGCLSIGTLHPLDRDVMGCLRYMNLQCKHNIYSMYHKVGGRLIINGILHSFLNGVGYIEGDEGTSFPKKYIWFNSINYDYGLTLAIATIPLCKVFRFTGCFLTIKDEDQEFVFSSLNGLRICKISKYLLILRKGSYVFKLYLDDSIGQKLYAPDKGEMKYFIHEAIKVISGFELFHKGKLIFNRYDVQGSLERVNM